MQDALPAALPQHAAIIMDEAELRPHLNMAYAPDSCFGASTSLLAC
ncbi:hypothetical protein [Polaromonas sp. CG_23.6]|nr:hypothetical protein [Polaromonas sp. CG_23.6]MDH6186001.1 hypothetical protein [Polaromonas sp. CG_23.6]